MKNNSRLPLFCAALAVTLLSAFWCAGACFSDDSILSSLDAMPRGASMQEKMETRIQEIYTQIGLTALQKKRIDDNKTKTLSQAAEAFKKLKKATGDIREELDQPRLNMGKINALHNEIKKQQNALADCHLQAVLEVRKILTPQQFAQYSQLMKKERTTSVVTP
ncbi:MAG: Spy/CpxP family protein refolding chaperone [Candidatus Omnitrophica bacterium]|nr:Spy/CpxP family protein refolding chaperone [Candidatus Omnitrophota bacterium]